MTAEKQKAIGKREAALIAAALDFIAKVDRGEARSKRSYDAFMAALRCETVEPTDKVVTQRIADYIYEQMNKLDKPILYTACLAMARHITALEAQPESEQIERQALIDQCAAAVLFCDECDCPKMTVAAIKALARE